MRASDKVVRDGKVYYSVRAAARELSTTANKVKEMMGQGELEWAQFGVNGRLWVTIESIVNYLKRVDIR